jgi:hypothetical protein
MIEINGVANILIIAETAKMNGEISEETYTDIVDQCDVMERYMLAVAEANRNGLPVPFWHEVRDNRLKYPKNGQRV